MLFGDSILTIQSDGVYGPDEIGRISKAFNDLALDVEPPVDTGMAARLVEQVHALRLRKLRELVIEKASKGEFDEESAAIIFEPEKAERLKVMASEILAIKGRIALAFHESGLPEVVTTFGVYPNGPSNTNGVALEDLPYHIWYNRSYRPGRALIVHNQVWYAGIGVDEEKLETERLACMAESFPIATRPYH